MAKNGDLKRFYPDNPQAGKDFARLDENGKIPSSNMPTGIVPVEANPTLAGTETELSGLQVGSTKYSVPKGTIVEGNPEIPEGTTPTDLSDIKIGDTYYSIPEGTEVVANPTLEGTEPELTGLQVGNTKYKVPSGGGDHLYQHNIIVDSKRNTTSGYWFTMTIVSSESTPYTLESIGEYCTVSEGNVFINCSCLNCTQNSSYQSFPVGVQKYNNNWSFRRGKMSVSSNSTITTIIETDVTTFSNSEVYDVVTQII